ncbi:uncharacterized protein [Magallana gigas]|uniref:uncharacterized protein n=1 Tax=Magallana gigas TaxID=29159 RepID=UPI003341F9BD
MKKKIFNDQSTRDTYFESPPYRFTSESDMGIIGLSVIILISAFASCICSAFCFCCYKRGFIQAQTSIQKNDQQEEETQYQGQNTSNEISDEDHAYEKPRPPTNETSQNHELELSAYEEVKENQIEECQFQKTDEGVYLTPVNRQHPLPSVGAGN